MSALTAHQRRVVAERDALAARLRRLRTFFFTETYAGLDEDERYRLRRQALAMDEYAHILGERIAAFGCAPEALLPEETKTAVSLDDIFAKIQSAEYTVLSDGRTTLCQLALENGFTVLGTAACVDRARFDAETGRRYAYADAVDKIWPLEGYLLAERMFHAKGGDRE